MKGDKGRNKIIFSYSHWDLGALIKILPSRTHSALFGGGNRFSHKLIVDGLVHLNIRSEKNIHKSEIIYNIKKLASKIQGLFLQEYG